MGTIKNLLIFFGWIIGYGGNLVLDFPTNIITLLVGLAMTLTGCYMWTKIKNRHWAFMFWGVLTPIGLLGISLLQDKSPYPGIS